MMLIFTWFPLLKIHRRNKSQVYLQIQCDSINSKNNRSTTGSIVIHAFTIIHYHTHICTPCTHISIHAHINTHIYTHRHQRIYTLLTHTYVHLKRPLRHAYIMQDHSHKFTSRTHTRSYIHIYKYKPTSIHIYIHSQTHPHTYTDIRIEEN